MRISSSLLTVLVTALYLDAVQARHHSSKGNDLCRCAATGEKSPGANMYREVDGVKVVQCDEKETTESATIRVVGNVFDHMTRQRRRTGEIEKTSWESSKSGKGKSKASKSSKGLSKSSKVHDGSEMGDTAHGKGHSSFSESSKSSSKATSKRGKHGSKKRMPPLFECPGNLTNEEDSSTSIGYIRGPVRDHSLAYGVPLLRREPSDAEAAALLDVTKEFWMNHFENYFESSAVQFEDLEIKIDEKLYNSGKPAPQFDYYLDMDVVVLYNEDSAKPPTPEETFSIMAGANFTEYILDYVRTVPPFESTDEVDFRAILSSSATTLSSNPTTNENIEEEDANKDVSVSSSFHLGSAVGMLGLVVSSLLLL